MRVTPTAQDWLIASLIHTEFLAKPESQFIASRFALAHLSAVLNQVKPKRVLEVGAGIGTVTKLLLTHPANVPTVISSETNEVCLACLARNLPAQPVGRWRLISGLSDVRSAETFEMVILDGGIEHLICPVFAKESVCFVEGNRRSQRRGLEQMFTDTGMQVAFEQYTPRWQLRLKPRRIFGMLPQVKLQRRKGCFVGRVRDITDAIQIASAA